jgi:opacity protein-like surface antigen
MSATVILYLLTWSLTLASGQIAEKDTHQNKTFTLIQKSDPEKKQTGKIIGVEADGIVFEPDQKSSFYNTDKKVVPLADILQLMDQDGKILYPPEAKTDHNITSNVVNKDPVTSNTAINPPGNTRTEADQKPAGDSLQESPDPQTLSQMKIVPPRYPYHLRLNLNYGYAHRLGDLSESVPTYLHDYANELKTGSNLTGEAIFFFTTHFGIGVRYNQFYSSNSQERVPFTDPETNEFLGYGAISEDITISHLAFGLYERRYLIDQKLQLVSNVSVGKISLKDESMVVNMPINIKGSTVGWSTGMGLDYFITPDIAFGLSVTFLQANLKDISVNGTDTTLDDTESLNRWDLNFGIQLFH